MAIHGLALTNGGFYRIKRKIARAEEGGIIRL
jgi:hypothetical protein